MRSPSATASADPLQQDDRDPLAADHAIGRGIQCLHMSIRCEVQTVLKDVADVLIREQRRRSTSACLAAAQASFETVCRPIRRMNSSNEPSNWGLQPEFVGMMVGRFRSPTTTRGSDRSRPRTLAPSPRRGVLDAIEVLARRCENRGIGMSADT